MLLAAHDTAECHAGREAVRLPDCRHHDDLNRPTQISDHLLHHGDALRRYRLVQCGQVAADRFSQGGHAIVMRIKRIAGIQSRTTHPASAGMIVITGLANAGYMVLRSKTDRRSA